MVAVEGAGVGVGGGGVGWGGGVEGVLKKKRLHKVHCNSSCIAHHRCNVFSTVFLFAWLFEFQ